MRKNQLRPLPALLAGAILCFSMGACSQPPTAKSDFFAMDTVMTVEVTGPKAKETITELEQLMNRLDQDLSPTQKGSQLFELNQSSSLPKQALGEDLQTLLPQSIELSQQTSGTFDITLGRLSTLWGFGQENQQVPTQQSIESALTQSGYPNLLLGEEVTLRQGIQLDLGAIAKGYATDQAVELLQQNQATQALLSLGGNVYVYGDHQGKPWKVGLASPDDPEEILGYLSLTDSAVITSGSYQRYFEQEGKRYHHIIDPSTGKPAETGLSSVTVISQDATRADAYSTALFVMGLERGLAFIQSQPGFEAVFVTQGMEIYCTKGAEQMLTLDPASGYRLSGQAPQ